MPGIRLEDISEVVQPQRLQPQGFTLSDIAEVVPERPAGHPATRPVRERIDGGNRIERFDVPTPFRVTMPPSEPAIRPGINLAEEAEQYLGPVPEQRPPDAETGLRDVALGAKSAVARWATLPGRALAASPSAPPHQDEIVQAAQEGILSPEEQAELVRRRSVTQQVLQGVGGAAVDLPVYAALGPALGPVGAMAAPGAVEGLAEGGPEGSLKGAAKGAVMGATLHALGPTGRAIRIPATAALGGTEAALAGGDTRDIAAAAITMGGLGALGGRREPRAPAEAPAPAPVEARTAEPLAPRLTPQETAQARLAELEAAQLARDRAAGPPAPEKPLFQEVQRSPERLPTGLQAPQRPIPISEILEAMEPQVEAAPIEAPAKPVAPPVQPKGHPAARRAGKTPVEKPTAPQAAPPPVAEPLTPPTPIEPPAPAPVVTPKPGPVVEPSQTAEAVPGAGSGAKEEINGIPVGRPLDAALRGGVRAQPEREVVSAKAISPEPLPEQRAGTAESDRKDVLEVQVQPWQMTSREYGAKGIGLPEGHPILEEALRLNQELRAAETAMLEKSGFWKRNQVGDLAARRTTLGALKQFEPHTVETALKSPKVPRELKDHYRKVKARREDVSRRADEAVDHRRLVEQALREGKPVPPEVLAEYPDLKAPPPATAADVTPEKPAAAPLVEGAAGGERGAEPPAAVSQSESSPGLVRDYLESLERRLKAKDPASKDYEEVLTEAEEYRSGTNLLTPSNYDFARDFLRDAYVRRNNALSEVRAKKSREEVLAQPWQRKREVATSVQFDKERSAGGKKEFRAVGLNAEGAGIESLTIKEGAGKDNWYIERDYYDKAPGPGNPYGAKKTETVSVALTKAEAKAAAEAYLKGQPDPFEGIRNGLPFSDYTPGKGQIKFEPNRFAGDGFAHNKVAGEDAWTNGVVAFKGKPPGPLSSSEKQPDVARVFEKVRKEAHHEILPVGFYRTHGVTRIVFDNNSVVDATFFDFARKQWPESRFRAKDNKSEIAVYSGGEIKGIVMPMRADEMPANLQTGNKPPSPTGHPAARRRTGERGAITIPAGAVAAITGRPIPTTPSEVYALENVARREAARTTGAVQGAWNKTKATIAKLKSQSVDATAPILDAIASAQREHGFELPPTQRIEGAIDKAYRSASIAEQFAKDHGLVDAIRAVDNLDYFEEYLLARHTADVRGRGFETGRDTVRDAALAQEFASRVAIPATDNTPAVTYRELGDRIARYSQDLLDYSVDAGTISPELADLLKRTYPDYVPIHRVFSEIERGTIPRRPGRAVASLSAQTLVRRLEGSERPIESPLGSLIDHTRLAIRQGEVNKAARMLAGYRDLPGMEGLITEVPQGTSVPKHSFSYLDAGRKRTFETTPEFAAAAKALDIQSIGVLGKIFAAPARVMKLFTTGVSAPFAFSNVMADALQTAVTSKYDNSLLSPGAFGKAFLAAFSPKHTHLWDDIVRQGGGFTSFDLFRGEPHQNVASIRSGRNPAARARYTAQHPIQSVGDLFRAAEDLVGRTEQFGRARIYEMTLEAARKQGMNEADARALAINESNNRLPNYLRFGSAMRSLNAAIPYLNANIQGSRSLLRAARENPGQTAARLGMALYLPVAVTTLWNISDPERRKAYEDIERWEKDNNLIWIPPNPTKDKQGRWNVVKVKITPGLSNLSVPLRRGLEQYAGLDPVGAGEIAQALFGAVSPIEASSKGLSTIVPQAIKPTVQAMANYDFFRQRPIVSDRLKDLPPNLQVMPYTSGTARVVGEKLGASPIKTEQFIKDTVGGIGPQILNASDRALAAAGVIPESQVGGTSTVEAVAARVGKARGGEREHKVYESLRKAQNTAIAAALERAKHSLPYLRAADEAARNKLLEQVANRARSRVLNLLPDNFKTLPVERKANIVERLSRRGHPAALAGVR